MEGFYIQNRAWFMFDPNFQKIYFTFGIEDTVNNPNLPMTMDMTTSMIINARTHLYGSIQISTRKAITVHKYLKRYKNTLDGILVWIAIQTEKDNDGNKDMKIQRLLSKSHRSFDGNYPGGLLQYCHDIESVYEELKELVVEVEDSMKRYNLLGNLESVDSTEAKFLREKFSIFDECLTHLKLYSSRQEVYTLQRAGQRVKFEIC